MVILTLVHGTYYCVLLSCMIGYIRFEQTPYLINKILLSYSPMIVSCHEHCNAETGYKQPILQFTNSDK